MARAQEHQVRERAYFIWEQQGRPTGRDVDHWLAAEQELASLPKRRAAARKAAPKRAAPKKAISKKTKGGS